MQLHVSAPTATANSKAHGFLPGLSTPSPAMFCSNVELAPVRSVINGFVRLTVQNSHDSDAQWSTKSTTKDKEWVGYKAQVAETVADETCDKGEPTANVITAIDTQEAIASDKAALPAVEEEWQVQNPHDSDAQWSTKSTTKDKEWVGYKAQVAETVADETCDKGEPTANVITAIDTQEAIASGKAALPAVEKEWQDKGVEKPQDLYLDGGYTSGNELARAQEEGRRLHGPMARAPAKNNRHGVEDFDIRVEERKATCPAGNTNSQCSKLTESATGKVSYRIEFARTDCQACPLKSQCLGKGQKHRTVLVSEHHTLIQARRCEQTTDEYKKDMHRRNGIEATISELVRSHGMRRSRYRGLVKTRLQNYMTGAACNIRRWAARSVWEKEQKTR